MPYAVALMLEGEAEAVVRELWRALAAVGETWLATSGAEPHVSLGIWDTIERDPFEAAVRDFAAATPAITVRLDGLGTFPGGVVFLRPLDDTPLRAAHAALHARVGAAAAGPWAWYLPGAWAPHCTLALDVSPERLDEALEVAGHAPLPVLARLASVAIVEVEPVRLVVRYPLGG